MTATLQAMRLDIKAMRKAAKSRSKKVHAPSQEVAALKRFQEIMGKNAGKLMFTNLDE
jgi:hypothetical protein